MRLSVYRKALGALAMDSREACVPAVDPDLTAVRNSSGAVIPGSLFCAIRGVRADGHAFLFDAVDRGAAALCVSAGYGGPLPDGVPVVRVTDSYQAWGILCEADAGRPADSFRVHTVTGTNGKTTSAFILRHLLAGDPARRTALLTTVLNDTLSPSGPESAAATMPDAAALQSLFTCIRDNGATDVVMESSSHGLHQHRAGSLKFASAIFTNLTGDHLDYHKTEEAYYQAKKQLFTGMLAPDAPAAINVDDAYGRRLFDELEGLPVRRLAFSSHDPRAFCRLASFRPLATGSALEFSLDGVPYRLTSPFRGEFNAYNLLGTLTVAYASGLSPDLLMARAETAPPAPGRLEPFSLPSGAAAFVDYAHTDDALFRVLTALRRILPSGGRLIAVFGCGGDRDRTKRPRMGRVVSELADFAVLTSDNPRSEDPAAILREIEPGLCAGFPHRTVVDRAEAIREAVALSRPGDLVLVAGKGHETYQEIAGVRYPFDDRAVIRSLQ